MRLNFIMDEETNRTTIRVLDGGGSGPGDVVENLSAMEREKYNQQ